MNAQQIQLATFASGCFWCTEAVFKRIRGVTQVTPGYTGGNTDNPSYDQLHTQHTGHAEAIQLEFDPSIITYQQLVEVFFGTHDPTTMNRQGNDVGEEYRSVIFYHDDTQYEIAERVKRQLEKDMVFDSPIVTEIIPALPFYPAEEEHRDFYERNQNQQYCQVVISPKLAKLRQHFAEYLK